MQKNENPVVLSLVLLVISVAVALLLSFTNSITKEKIAENTIKEQNEAKQSVLPAASEFIDLEYQNGNVNAVFQAVSGEKMLGWCVNVTAYGYGGAIDIMVGVNPDLTLSGVKVVSNSETAGLGAKCADDTFSGQFLGKFAPLSVIKNGTADDNEIVAITGTTVTSKAVTNGVNSAIEAVKAVGGGLYD